VGITISLRFSDHKVATKNRHFASKSPSSWGVLPSRGVGYTLPHDEGLAVALLVAVR
jgi:hypothetical protein